MFYTFLQSAPHIAPLIRDLRLAAAIEGIVVDNHRSLRQEALVLAQDPKSRVDIADIVNLIPLLPHVEIIDLVDILLRQPIQITPRTHRPLLKSFQFSLNLGLDGFTDQTDLLALLSCFSRIDTVKLIRWCEAQCFHIPKHAAIPQELLAALPPTHSLVISGSTYPPTLLCNLLTDNACWSLTIRRLTINSVDTHAYVTMQSIINILSPNLTELRVHLGSICLEDSANFPHVKNCTKLRTLTIGLPFVAGEAVAVGGMLSRLFAIMSIFSASRISASSHPDFKELILSLAVSEALLAKDEDYCPGEYVQWFEKPALRPSLEVCEQELLRIVDDCSLDKIVIDDGGYWQIPLTPEAFFPSIFPLLSRRGVMQFRPTPSDTWDS